MDLLKQIQQSGGKVLDDTKTKKKKEAKVPKLQEVPEADPHKAFIRRCIAERPSKEEVVKALKKFIEAEEALL